MNKRFKPLQIIVASIAVLSILMVGPAVSRAFSETAASAGLNWPPRPIIVPVTGTSDLSDYHQRHREAPAAPSLDLSDYYLRHPESKASTPSVDLDDYYLRHPERGSKQGRLMR
jgi:hypothetical protein